MGPRLWEGSLLCCSGCLGRKNPRKAMAFPSRKRVCPHRGDSAGFQEAHGCCPKPHPSSPVKNLGFRVDVESMTLAGVEPQFPFSEDFRPLSGQPLFYPYAYPSRTQLTPIPCTPSCEPVSPSGLVKVKKRPRVLGVDGS